MNSNKSFSQRLQEGASPEELKKEYALNDNELNRVMDSLKNIHNLNSKAATQGRSYGQALLEYTKD
jgi:hypothetical protein